MVVHKVYIDQYLKGEEDILNDYYISYLGDIANVRLRQNTTSLLDIDTVLKLEDRWNSEKDKIQQRKQLAEDYIDLLQQIVTSHQKLAVIYDNGQKLSQNDVEKMLHKNIKALDRFMKTAEKVSSQVQN